MKSLAVKVILVVVSVSIGWSCRHRQNNDNMNNLSSTDEGSSHSLGSRLYVFGGVYSDDFKIKCGRLVVENGNDIDFLFGYKLKNAKEAVFEPWLDREWIGKIDLQKMLAQIKNQVALDFTPDLTKQAINYVCQQSRKNMTQTADILGDQKDSAKGDLFARNVMLIILKFGDKLTMEYDDYFEN